MWFKIYIFELDFFPRLWNFSLVRRSPCAGGAALMATGLLSLLQGHDLLKNMDPVHKLIWQKCFDLGGQLLHPECFAFLLTRFLNLRVLTPLRYTDLLRTRRKIDWTWGFGVSQSVFWSPSSVKTLQSQHWHFFFSYIFSSRPKWNSYEHLTPSQFLAQLKTLRGITGRLMSSHWSDVP